jgi:PTS system galactitol-specific IIA component
MIVSEQLIEAKIDAKDKEDVIRLLSGKMDKLGLVEAGFTEAVLERERKFPTGLPTRIPVALCHVEADYVKETALACATVKDPVLFRNMGDPSVEVAVKIVFLLTIVDPKQQVLYLRKMMEFFKDDTLERIDTALTKDEIYKLLKDAFMETPERK